MVLVGRARTRLAIEVGQKVQNSFPDGVYFVALAPLTSPINMVTATASAVGFIFIDPSDQSAQLFRFLRAKRPLLIFDNLEHLLPEATAFLEEILKNVPQAHLLVTSRRPMNVPWEWAYSLRGLDHADSGSSPENKQTAAGTLFLQQLRRSGYAVKDGDECYANQISQMVHGLPLALILAASWGNTLGCEEIVAEIQRGVSFLQSRQQSFSDKHRSMQVVFEYSWQLLSDREKAVLRRLTVFRGGFSREAAAEVAGAELNTLADLVDQSLVERISSNRYRIHELLRQYLQDRLSKSGEEEEFTRDQHLAFFTRLAEQAEPEMKGGKQKIWIERLIIEYENINTALEWSLFNLNYMKIESGLRLMISTKIFWSLYAYTKIGFTYVNKFLELNLEEFEMKIFAKGLNLGSLLAFILENLTEAKRMGNEALFIGQKLKDYQIIGDAYINLAMVAAFYVDNTAKSFAQNALENYEMIGDLSGKVYALNLLGRADIMNGNYQTSFKELSLCLKLSKELEDTNVIISVLNNLGMLALTDLRIGPTQAREYLLEGSRIANSVYDMDSRLLAKNMLGESYRLENRFEQAASIFEEVLDEGKEIGWPAERNLLVAINLGSVYLNFGKHVESKILFLNNLDIARNAKYLSSEVGLCLLGLSGIALFEGQFRLAAMVIGMLTVFEPYQNALKFWLADKKEYDRIISTAHALIPENQFNQFFEEGKLLCLEDTIQLVKNWPEEEKTVVPGPLNDLTSREFEVLQLVAHGLSDSQVADRLVISPRTVNAHLTSIYSKLGVNSRAAATRFAMEKGLV